MLDHVDRIQAEWRQMRPGVDVAPQGVIGRLHRLADLLLVEIETVLAQHGVTQGEFDVLASLRRAGEPFERKAGEVAEHTMVTSGATTKRIDRLERSGLVARRRSGDDGRQRIVALTAEGLRVVDAAFDAHMANEHRLLAVLSNEERTALETLLKGWLGRI